MANVVHLSDEAHASLKQLAQQRGVHMKDVAVALIDDALRKAAEPPSVAKQQTQQDAVTEALLAKPPFWADRRSRDGKR